MRCLVLRLQAPLMAFGDVAVDEIRPTRRLPTLSMMTGLLGNALGWDHSDVDLLQRLQDRLLLAARLDREGRVIVDFQTAEIAQKDPLWTTRGKPAERFGGAQSYSGPVIRYRHYLADAAVTVALALDPEHEAPTIDALAAALRRPERPLFLGRKGCLPAGPLLLGEPIEQDSLAAALATVEPLPSDHPLAVELPDRACEPEGLRTFELADRRDWRLGLHTGTRRMRSGAPAREGQS